jgi:DNA repair protein RecO (recombination protein O)
MQWHDEGIIVHTKVYGESSLLVSLLTREHGRAKGLLASRIKQNHSLQLGSIVNARWNARLAEHLGRFQLEAVFSPFSRIVNSNEALLSLTAACAWVELLLPENEPNVDLFEAMSAFLKNMTPETVFQNYLIFEKKVLQVTGLDLSLDQCAATGEREDLVYISPKTGRAVSRAAGLPYHNKLLALPACLRDGGVPKAAISGADLETAFDVIEYFLEHFVLHVHNLKMPSARQRLRACVGRSRFKEAL